jgi:hypothetical protein
MNNFRSIGFAAVIAAVALPTFGQSKDAPAPTPARAASAVGMDCGPRMKPHDHAAEKGMGSGMKGAHCDGKAMSQSKAKKKPLHDHGKEHKQQ